MKKYEAEARTPQLLKALLDIWEDSVRATHLFLFDAEIKSIREYVPQALGGVQHLMVADLYIAAFVFSLHKAEPDKISPDIVNEMVTAVFDSPFMIKAHKNKKCTLFTDKVQDKKVKESIASQTSKYELDWKFHYEKGINEFYNTYTECGICKLGKRENCFEFVPCLCNMDERNYRNDGGQLHRTKTLAQGDDCCNFHVTRIKTER